VVDISAGGLQVECAAGFADETIRRLSGGSFEFVLRDPTTDNEIELIGELVRCERADDNGRVVRIWIAKNEKHWPRPARREAGPEIGQQHEDAISLDVGRARAGRTITVGGGKGGVGKTIVSVNLALALSRLLKNVTLFDGDVGNCNCNTLLGITRVDGSLEEYLRKERSLDEITVSTAYPGLRLVCGAQNKVDAFLTSEMPRLLNDIRQIDADCLVIDLGAGMSDETLDLYRLADDKIIVVTPQVTSLQNAYGFIKSAFFHDLKRSGLAALLDKADSDPQKLHTLIESLEEGHTARHAFAVVRARQRFKIVGNMVNDDKDLKIVQNLQKVVGQYLHIDNTILGTIATSEDIRNSVNRITPFVALSPDSPHSLEMKRMTARLTQGTAGTVI
jgi:flagellar biosynthesis protein FlhG